MDDPPLVSGCQSRGELPSKFYGLVWGEDADAQPRAQRLAVEELHHGKGHSLLYAEVMDGQDIGMRERRNGLGLSLESGHRRRVVCDLGWQHLDRHLAVELHVARPVHLAHTARADRSENLVVAEAGSRRQRHLPSSAVRRLNTGFIPRSGGRANSARSRRNRCPW